MLVKLPENYNPKKHSLFHGRKARKYKPSWKAQAELNRIAAALESHLAEDMEIINKSHSDLLNGFNISLPRRQGKTGGRANGS